MKIEFRLNEFRDVAKWLDKKLPMPLAFFLKGWLYALEDAWIEAKAISTVEKAIGPHRPPPPTLRAPTHYIEPSEIEDLDIIGYSYDFDPPERGGEEGMS